MVAACRVGGRKTIPLALRLWSSRAPGFKGENDEVLNIVKSVYDATGGKGVMVYDRGGDRFLRLFDREQQKFHHPSQRKKRHVVEGNALRT
jgi:hypothetical protein